MPNHVYNEVTMRNIVKKDYFSEGVDDYTGEKFKYFDFNKLIPMPESLNMISGSVEDYATEEAMIWLVDRYLNNSIQNYGIRQSLGVKKFLKLRKLFTKIKEDHDKSMSKFLGSGETSANIEEYRKMGIQYLTNIVNYGYSTWYNWCVENWGTKWNSYNNAEYDDDTIAFNTAWDIPNQIYLELSRQNPYDEITVRWDNEGGIAGTNIYLDGECVYEESHQSEFEETDEEHDVRYPYVSWKRTDDYPRRRLFSRCNPNEILLLEEEKKD